MEEGIDSFLNCIVAEFDSVPQDLRTYSPLTFAFVGDAFFSMVIRTLLICRGNTNVNKLTLMENETASAVGQHALLKKIIDKLSDEEMDVFTRGKNAKVKSSPKNTKLKIYKEATGFESLIGWLYLSGNQKRALSLIKMGLEE